MARKLGALVFVVMSLTLSLAIGQDSSPALRCSTLVSIEGQPSESPLSLQALSFSAAAVAHGALGFANKSAKTLEFYLITIDLLGADGNYITTVPIMNVSDNDNGTPFDVPFRPWLESGPQGFEWPTPPGVQEVRAFAVQLTTLTCPESARVSMIQLRYTDKTRFRYVAPSMSVPPVLSHAGLVQAKSLDAWKGITVIGTLAIDSSGKAQIESMDSASPALQHWLEKAVGTWRFSAALAGGQPVNSRLPFMLMIDNDSGTVLTGQCV